MSVQSNGLFEIAGKKNKERGFNCMQLIIFLTDDNVKEWDLWHQRHIEASEGNCFYKEKCKIRRIAVTCFRYLSLGLARAAARRTGNISTSVRKNTTSLRFVTSTLASLKNIRRNSA